MEDRDTAKLATGPFGQILFEFRIHRLKERSYERHLPCRARYRAFLT